VVFRFAAEGAARIAGERARQREDAALRRVAGGADVRQLAGDDAGDTGQLDALEFRTNINLKKIPSVGGEGDEVRQLTVRDFADVTIHEIWREPDTVELRPNARLPVYLLPVLEVEAAFHWRVDFTLVCGRVLEELE
jgi:acetoacetate decarboxylase